ncbi:pyridoxamine 5'-phosphate oxidase family protein [Micromonospora sp. NPDC005222]|uniref:pyridoxamine 5'-phosphate oxidase family protein n=1 Tax=unclassified Micromonospora TaxID=2617518 RepID=UPI0033B99E92
MTWWSDLVAAEPEFAARVRARFAVRKHGTMATVRRDGSPRISGTEFEFGDDGQLRLGSMAGAVKALDLRRDPRVALHSPTEDAPPDDPSTWTGTRRSPAGRTRSRPPRTARTASGSS